MSNQFGGIETRSKRRQRLETNQEGERHYLSQSLFIDEHLLEDSSDSDIGDSDFEAWAAEEENESIHLDSDQEFMPALQEVDDLHIPDDDSQELDVETPNAAAETEIEIN
jgi:hypothetical protein